MIIDPHIAFISTATKLAPELYPAVMARIAARTEQPRGILMHFSTMHSDGFRVGTVFADSDSMLDGFLGFSAPEAQNEMVASGHAADITRDEHSLERLLVSEEVEARPFSFVPSGEIAACSSEPPGVGIEAFRKSVEEAGPVSESVPGRLASIAYREGDMVQEIEFWDSRERGQRWYEENAHSNQSWLQLNSFVVCAAQDDPVRRFTRKTDGPVQL
ncbi:MAG: hypothetical protein JHD02_11675 [Thermoleophilaceae bacterium]|nr:hypothetical protein [Thermoleophilaceae bacterium]